MALHYPIEGPKMTDEHDPVSVHSPGTTEEDSPTRTPAPRYQYTEYELRDTTIAMIRDISDPTVWIQSNVTYPVEA